MCKKTVTFFSQWQHELMKAIVLFLSLFALAGCVNPSQDFSLTNLSCNGEDYIMVGYIHTCSMQLEVSAENDNPIKDFSYEFIAVYKQGGETRSETLPLDQVLNASGTNQRECQSLLNGAKCTVYIPLQLSLKPWQDGLMGTVSDFVEGQRQYERVVARVQAFYENGETATAETLIRVQ